MPRNKSLKKEQIALLRYEKSIAASAAVLGAIGAGAAASANDTLDGLSMEALAKIQEAHIALAQAVSDAHDAMQEKAVAVGAPLVDGGLPKERLVEAVKSTLGLG